MDAGGVRDRADDLPADPGVYQFHEDETVLYVGKAVDLRDRVRSYADPRSPRVARMVERADRVEVAVTETETQALLLEANLIKRHQPPYNVRLKDDKSYPLVQLTDHPVPRIEVTRDPDEGATVFGPFTDRGEVETVVKAVRETYGLRGCADHKYAGRDRPCLDHDVGLCSAPCTGEIGEAAYREDVEAVRRFFRGETGVLADPLRRAMEEAASAERFERAANLRDRLAVVESFHRSGDAAVSADDADGGTVDVLGAAVAGDRATVARLHAERGKLVDRSRHRLDVDPPTDTTAVLGAFVPQFYADRDLPDVVCCPERLPEEVRSWLADRGVDVRVPGAGREARLVDLALRNARRDDAAVDPCAALASALDLPRAERIEGVDVSHTAGGETVGANVCFVDGAAERSAYRRVRLDDANDDPASVYDLVRWRADRAVEGRDDRPDPDLLLVDGGEEQLRSAREALDDAGWTVPVVALAKSEERVVTPDGTHRWPDDAPHRHLCQRVRDEAHRFAVQYHRTLRDDVSTALDGIEGVGPTLRRRLLGRFGSVANVREASRAELLAVEGVGEATADRIANRL